MNIAMPLMPGGTTPRRGQHTLSFKIPMIAAVQAGCIPPLFAALCALLFCSNQIQAAPGSTNQSGVQLAIELRDGSRVVGKSMEDTLTFHSAALGDMKLEWSGIRSIEYAGTNTSVARLTATNGDGFAIQLAADTLRVETGFGQTEMPVKLIRSVKVSPARGNAATGTATAQLTIELRDGSRMVGKGLDEALNFHAPAMGDLKLTWAAIRAIEYSGTNTEAGRLTATNGDVYEAQFSAPSVRVETTFGNAELPVKMIRSIKVSMAGNAGQLASGLVALWSGEGDGNDSVGGNTAMLTDITYVEGRVGQAFSFNGASSSIRVPASPALDVGAGDGFTIMAWIKPTDVDGWRPLFQWELGTMYGEGPGLSLNARPTDSGGLWSGITTVTGNRLLASPRGLVIAGVWQHVALTYDKASGIGTLYLNGVTVGRRQLIGPPMSTKGDLWISRRNTHQGDWSSNRSYSGLMDEIAIYNRALSASEIQAICTEQSNGEPLTQPAPSTGWFEPWMQ